MDYKKILISLTTVGALFFVFYSATSSPVISDQRYTYLGGMEFYNSYEEGLKVAQKEDKPIFMYFWAIWCSYCKKYQTEVFPSPEVNRTLEENFVLVAVDLDSNKKDASRFNVQYPPHIIYLTPQGEIIGRIGGYTDKEDFLRRTEGALAHYGGGP